MACSIPLSTGGYVWLDDFDYAAFDLFTWQCDDSGYVMRWRPVNGVLEPLYLARLIVGAWPGDSVIHRDGNKLNNRFRNLHLTKAR